MTEKQIPENPLLKKLIAEGATDAITFRGYIGPPSTGGHITLYPNLDDLSESVEIAQGDILDFAELPETTLPLGAAIIWVKKDATITHRNARAVGKISDQDVRPDVREAGRLRLFVRRRASDVCQSRCAVCHSRCQSRCQSRCFS